MTFADLATLAVVSLLLIVAFSPVGSLRVAAVLEAVARELRHHGGAMAGAYAAYRGIQRTYRRPDIRTQRRLARVFRTRLRDAA